MWACESDPANPLGVGYILMEKLDGSPFSFWMPVNEFQSKTLEILQQLFNSSYLPGTRKAPIQRDEVARADRRRRL